MNTCQLWDLLEAVTGAIKDFEDALAGRVRYVYNKETGDMELRRWKKGKAKLPRCAHRRGPERPASACRSPGKPAASITAA